MFHGSLVPCAERRIIKMIIALIRNDTPKEELIEYLTELIKE